MVAIALDKLSFQVPEVLQSFELSKNSMVADSHRELKRQENRFSIEEFARESCEPIALAVNHRLMPQLNNLAKCANRNELINEYNSILQSLNSMSSEWTEFMRDVWRCNAYTTNSTTRSLVKHVVLEERQRIENESLSHSLFKPAAFTSVVTAKFVSEHNNHLITSLTEDYRGLLNSFVQNCVQQLLEMVNAFTIGIAQWYPGNNCRYIFFRRKISSVVDQFGALGGPAGGTTTIDVECHDHHLIDAFWCHPENSPMALPDRARELVSKTPSWLTDHLGLIVGTMTQESIHNRVILDRTWRMSEYFPRMHFDPAICIGSFVLTGWGPTDDDASSTIADRISHGAALPLKDAGSKLSSVGKIVSNWLGGN